MAVNRFIDFDSLLDTAVIFISRFFGMMKIENLISFKNDFIEVERVFRSNS